MPMLHVMDKKTICCFELRLITLSYMSPTLILESRYRNGLPYAAQDPSVFNFILGSNIHPTAVQGLLVIQIVIGCPGIESFLWLLLASIFAPQFLNGWVWCPACPEAQLSQLLYWVVVVAVYLKDIMHQRVLLHPKSQNFQYKTPLSLDWTEGQE